jgi:hypothetical protein
VQRSGEIKALLEQGNRHYDRREIFDGDVRVCEEITWTFGRWIGMRC